MAGNGNGGAVPVLCCSCRSGVDWGSPGPGRDVIGFRRRFVGASGCSVALPPRVPCARFIRRVRPCLSSSPQNLVFLKKFIVKSNYLSKFSFYKLQVNYIISYFLSIFVKI